MDTNYQKIQKQTSVQKLKSRYYNESYLWNSYSNKYNIDKKDFINIVKGFNFILMNYIIESGNWVYMPNVGPIGIRKEKTGFWGIVDFFHYQKTGEIIVRKNQHSEGWAARFRLITSDEIGSKLPKHLFRIWSWKATRHFKRLLARKIIDDNYITKYY